MCLVRLEVHYELLPPSKTIDFDLYCQQLTSSKQVIEKNYPGLRNWRASLFSYWKYQTTYNFNHPAKVAKPWLGCFNRSYSCELSASN